MCTSRSRNTYMIIVLCCWISYGVTLDQETGFWVLTLAKELGFGFWAQPGGWVLGFGLSRKAGFWVLGSAGRPGFEFSVDP